MSGFQGAFTALVTPMRSDGSVDYEGFRTLVRAQLDAGISGLVPLGTTGETPSLERDEQDEIIKATVEEVAGRVPVVVGVGSNSTSHTIDSAARAKELGADAVLVVTPYYNKPNDQGIFLHFQAVAKAAGLPVVVYNIESRTGKNITPALMDRLSKIPGIVAVKEASGNLPQMGDMIAISKARAAEGKDFTVLSGDDAYLLPLCALGGHGVVSVISNLVPERVVALTASCLSGDFAAARKEHFSLLPLIKGAFVETNPIPIKTAMGWAGLPAGPVRLPLGPLSEESVPKLRAALAAANVPLAK